MQFIFLFLVFDLPSFIEIQIRSESQSHHFVFLLSLSILGNGMWLTGMIETFEGSLGKVQFGKRLGEVGYGWLIPGWILYPSWCEVTVGLWSITMGWYL